MVCPALGRCEPAAPERSDLCARIALPTKGKDSCASHRLTALINEIRWFPVSLLTEASSGDLFPCFVL
jgi:hypothetical protein